MVKMLGSGAGRAGPGSGAGLGPALPQEGALGAAPGPASPPGRRPGPGRAPFLLQKDTLLVWPDFPRNMPRIGAWGPREPFILPLAGPGPGRSPQARARPSPPGPAPAQPGPGQNANVAQDGNNKIDK